MKFGELSFLVSPCWLLFIGGGCSFVDVAAGDWWDPSAFAAALLAGVALGCMLLLLFGELERHVDVGEQGGRTAVATTEDVIPWCRWRGVTSKWHGS